MSRLNSVPSRVEHGKSFITPGPGLRVSYVGCTKIVSVYDQEIPQSQTADKPITPRGRAAQKNVLFS